MESRKKPAEKMGEIGEEGRLDLLLSLNASLEWK
jgi:hypothetical protein